jgi:myo-inositol-1(or 4)-monophosphatase
MATQAKDGPQAGQENEAAQLLAAARLAADRAAAFLREQEGRLGPEAWSEKAKADFVTEVDKESERLMGETLLSAVPGSLVVGEELSPNALAAERAGTVRRSARAPVRRVIWIVDPLDGTTNFLHGFPAWAVSIAAARGGRILAGLVLDVPRGIRYQATIGGGAWQDERRLAVSTVSDPKHALIGTGFPYSDMDELPRYQRRVAAVIAGAAGVRRVGSAALDLCDVAAGRYQGFWELRLAPWDVAAGVLLVREAGGIVTDLEAGEDVISEPCSVVAGSPAIHAWLMKTLTADERR